MKMTIKDSHLPKDIEYNIFEYSPGYRGRNYNPFLEYGPPPTPIFNVTLTFLDHVPPELMPLIRNINMLGILIDEILIETENVPAIKYEKVIIIKLKYNMSDRVITYKVYFEALRMRLIQSPQQAREFDVLKLIYDGELWIGVKK